MVAVFLSVSIKGKEFLFDKSRTIGVPKSSAKKIRDVLNKQKYKLKNDNEIWHIHDNDWYFNDFIEAEIKRFQYGKPLTIYQYRG